MKNDSTTKMKLPISRGNRKLNGKGNVIIFNITSGYSCPTDARGECPLGIKNGTGQCYCIKSERMYPNVRAFRARQTEWWDNHFDPFEFVNAIKPRTKFLRFSESGDFRDQDDVDQMTEVCILMTKHNITCYGYTRRVDLDYSQLSRVANIMVTGKALPGCSQCIVFPKNAEAPEGYYTCPGKNCMVDCTMCAQHGAKVMFHLH